MDSANGWKFLNELNWEFLDCENSGLPVGFCASLANSTFFVAKQSGKVISFTIHHFENINVTRDESGEFYFDAEEPAGQELGAPKAQPREGLGDLWSSKVRLMLFVHVFALLILCNNHPYDLCHTLLPLLRDSSHLCSLHDRQRRPPHQRQGVAVCRILPPFLSLDR